MLFFRMGLGLIASKTMSEALSLRPLSVLGYAIDNNLLGAHGWSRVWVLAQNTSDDKMLEKIKRRVGQMEKAHKMRMKHGSIISCASASFPKTYSIQTAQGKFVVAPNCH
jgi:hypothetical protein